MSRGVLASTQHLELQRCVDQSEILTDEFLDATTTSRWVILGGTGFVGRWLTLFGQEIARRTKRPSLVCVVTRDVKFAEAQLRSFLPSQYPLPAIVQIEDLLIESKFSKVMMGVDTIFHAATSTNDKKARLSEIPRLTSQILEHCKMLERPRFVHLSSGGVYQREDFVGKQVPEGTKRVERSAAINSYQRTKIELEEMVEEATISGLIRGINPRLFAFGGPGFPINSDYAFAEFMKSALVGKRIEIRGNKDSHRSYMHPVDMTAWLLRAWEHIDVLGQSPVHIGSPIPVSMMDLALGIAQEFGGIDVFLLDQRSQQVEWYVPETLALRRLGAPLTNSVLHDIVKSWRRFLSPNKSSWN